MKNEFILFQRLTEFILKSKIKTGNLIKDLAQEREILMNVKTYFETPSGNQSLKP